MSDAALTVAANLPAKPYEPTVKEAAAIARWEAGKDNSTPLPALKIEMTGDGAANIGPSHEDLRTGTNLHMAALGAAYPEYYSSILTVIGNLSTTKQRQVDEQKANQLMAMVAGVNPRDQVESMLAVQMAAIHDASMSMAARLHRAENGVAIESAEKALNKLMRTFAAQMEALKRYRSKGEQRVYVERVNVEAGAQAVVGNVGRGEG